MKSQLTLLVVEDRANHLQDFNDMFSKEQFPVQIDVLHAADLESALQLLPRADAVITDVFFPNTPGGEEMPNGKIVVELCLAEKKPVVWITSTYHHGDRTNAVSEWGRKRGLEMFDCPTGGQHGEAPHKPWRHALLGVLVLIVALEEGNVLLGDNKFMCFAPSGYHRPMGTYLQYVLMSGSDCSLGAKMVQLGFDLPLPQM